MVASTNRVAAQRGSTPLPASMCHLSRYYTSASSTVPAEEGNLADHWSASDIEFWAALGYRLVRSCAAAQIRIEDEVRLIGPPNDPESRVSLAVILKVGTRTEKIEIPYAGRLRSNDNFSIGKKFGSALPDILAKIDPTFKTKFLKCARKHAEENHKQNIR